MKKNTVKAGLLGGVVVFVFACNGEKKEPMAAAVDKEQIKKEIQPKEDDFASIYNKRQLRNIGYYADDATVFYQHRAVSYTHLRAHETPEHLVCRLLLEKKK